MAKFWLAVVTFLAMLVFSAAGSPSLAQRRLALVIGNNAYAHVGRLEKAASDAAAVASALQALNFEVDLAIDTDRRAFILRLAKFSDRVRAGDFVLFYFAGHGVEIRGANYLLPTDVSAATQESLLTNEAIPVEKIISDLQERDARAMVVILDACRDNPFKREGTRGAGGLRGLARAVAPEGVFILYSAGVGQSALDRLSPTDVDPNSVFTRVFLREMRTPGSSLLQIAKRTQAEVRQIALGINHTQMPAYYDQVLGQIYLGDTPASEPAPAISEHVVPEVRPPEAVLPAAQPPPAPVQTQSSPRGTLTNKGFDWYYAEKYRSARERANLAVPRAVATCDRLASLGIDNPDSAAPRVARGEIDVAAAVPACVAAILQEPALARLRLQLARALLASAGKTKKEKLVNKIAGLSMLHDLAVDGYPAAMWQVAIHYYREKDFARAASWFRKAADKGLAVAMSDMGYLYENGEGVAKDAAEAVKWFERSAAGGHPGGMRNFALVLDHGMGGLQRDPARSADFLLTAFRMGSDSARRSLFELHESWSRETKAEVQRQLASHGFYRGAVDGEFDAETFTALTALAEQNPGRAAP